MHWEDWPGQKEGNVSRETCHSYDHGKKSLQLTSQPSYPWGRFVFFTITLFWILTEVFHLNTIIHELCIDSDDQKTQAQSNTLETHSDYLWN